MSDQPSLRCRVVPQLLFILLLLLCVAFPAWAVRVEAILPFNVDSRPPEWEASIAALRALGEAVEDEGLRLQVRTALQDVSCGFRLCTTAIYRCNDEGKVTEVVLENLSGALVHWDRFPSSIERLFVLDSVMHQPLILTDFPLNVRHFTSRNTVWRPGTITATADTPPACARAGADYSRCTYALESIECDACNLTRVDMKAPAGVFSSLKDIHLLQNPDMVFSLTGLPATILSLKLPYANFAGTSVRTILGALPLLVERLNISYTKASLEWDMLQSVPRTLNVLDISGLAIAEDDRAPQEIVNRLCHNEHFSLSELYLANTQLRGTVPDLRDCKTFAALDFSHNALTTLPPEHMPNTLEILHANSNALGGSLDTALLPRTLRSLDVSSNQLSGAFSVKDLPLQLHYLDISNNRFSGSLNLTALPETMKFVYLQHNHFTGEPDLVDIPLGIRFLVVHHNSWDYRLPAP